MVTFLLVPCVLMIDCIFKFLFSLCDHIDGICGFVFTACFHFCCNHPPMNKSMDEFHLGILYPTLSWNSFFIAVKPATTSEVTFPQFFLLKYCVLLKK